MSKGWRFANCDDPDPDNPEDWEKHERMTWRFVPFGSKEDPWGAEEGDFDSSEDAASAFDWTSIWPDLLGEDSTIRKGFEVWVKDPEGDVDKLHVSVELEPVFSAGVIS